MWVDIPPLSYTYFIWESLSVLQGNYNHLSKNVFEIRILLICIIGSSINHKCEDQDVVLFSLKP